MSYNKPGQWQTVAGLCRMGTGADPDLHLTLRPLAPGRNGEAENWMCR